MLYYLDEMELDKMGIDEMGVDKMGGNQCLVKVIKGNQKTNVRQHCNLQFIIINIIYILLQIEGVTTPSASWAWTY